MKIELIPSLYMYFDYPTPVATVCEKCCKHHGLREGKEYFALFKRFSFIGTVGSMNVITDDKVSVQSCTHCYQKI